MVLLSGGLDSATTLAVARHDGFVPHALAIDYGQRHRHELIAAERLAAGLGAASFRVLPLNLRLFGGSSLTSDAPVPKDRPNAAAGAGPHVGPGAAPEAEQIPSTYVPARNLVFLSLALALAETLSGVDLFIGVNAVDYSGYPDCRPEFISAFESTANLATKLGVTRGSPRVRVHTPLISLTKAQIIRLGHGLGVPFGSTHSCYDPVMTAGPEAGPASGSARGETAHIISAVRACGHCDSCLIRRQGFLDAGVPDPTSYAG